MLLVLSGVFLLNKAEEEENYRKPYVLTFLTLSNIALVVYTAELYETGLIFLVISLILLLILRKKHQWLSLILPNLYLVRPELALLSVTLLFYLMAVERNKADVLRFFLLGSIPVIVYQSYMYLETGELVPTSVVGRKLIADEIKLPYSDKVKGNIVSLFNFYGLYILAGLTAYVIYLLDNKNKFRLEYSVLLLPLLSLYLAFPPKQGYLIRYLLPSAPVFILIINSLTEQYLKKLKHWHVLLMTVLVLCFQKYKEDQNGKLNEDLLLMKDLGEKINGKIDKKDKILLYEIQGQYNIDAYCVSADGIVGNEMHDALMRKIKFSDNIRRENIRYIATINNYHTSTLFRKTFLEELYFFDMRSKVRDSIIIDKILVTKILTNPNFEDPMYYNWKIIEGERQRVYGAFWKDLQGEPFEWNSVFELKFL